MKTEITELIKLLNQGVKQLPATVDMLVRQYAMREWLIAGSFLAIALVCGPIAYKLVKRGVTAPKHHWGGGLDDTLEQGAFAQIVIGAVLAVVCLCLLIESVSCAANAISPVYSLIRSLK